MQHVQQYEKMLHGQTLKSATSDYDQRHVIAFRPISVAARSWSYDNQTRCPEVDMSSRGRSPSDDISTEGQHT